MAKPTLEVWEVSLIKGMLKRGMPNKEIQFYFNTPDRAVNSGRISEIKGGGRWVGIVPATQFEVDDFIDSHPMRAMFNSRNEPSPPIQNPAAALFTVDDDDLIEVRESSAARIKAESEDLQDLFVEMREKAEFALAIGHNNLGDLRVFLERFLSRVQGSLKDASVLRVWSAGSTLRSILRAHDVASGGGEVHAATLDPLCAEKLRDLVEVFNVFAAADPDALLLDQQKTGPVERSNGLQVLQLAQPILKDAGDISSAAVANLLVEQEKEAASASADADGDRQVAAAKDTVSNFVLTLVLGAYRRVRRVVGAEVKKAWDQTTEAAYKAFGTTVGTAAGAATVAAGSLAIGALGKFVLGHLESLRAFVQAAFDNPAVAKILEFLINLL